MGVIEIEKNENDLMHDKREINETINNDEQNLR